MHQEKTRKRGKSKDVAANDAEESGLVFTGERIVPQADNCEPNFASRMYQEHIARYLFASQIVAGKAVIDIGCGVGYGSQRLAQLGAAFVHAFDLSEDAIRHARIHYAHPNVHYEAGNAERFSADRQYDVAICFELIEHVRNPRAVMKNIRSALTGEGILVMSTPRALEEKRTHFHEHEFGLEEYVKMISEYFGEVEIYVENNHFTSLVTKGRPADLQKIICLKDQFDPAVADVFISVASASGPLPRMEPALAIDSDAYVTMLERDVEILHKAERDLLERAEVIDKMRVDEGAFKDREIERLTGEYQALFTRSEELSTNLWKAGETAKQQHTEITSLTMECKTLREAADHLSNQLRESEMRHAELQQEQKKLREEMDLLTVRSADADARRLEAYEFARVASQDARGLRSELDGLKRDIADALDRPSAAARVQDSQYDERHREIVQSMERLFLGTEATHHIARDPIVDRVARLSLELNEQRERANHLTREIEALQEFQRHAEDWHRQLLRIRKSASWRMTAPIRALTRPLRGKSS
ncbi:MAG: methyltransferase domain-containing protein [Rhizomicrobium sp.]